MSGDQLRACVVTGASAGIGRATSARLVGDGWAVVGLDVNEQGLERLAADYPERFRACVGSMADENALGRAADLAEEAGVLSGWVNNAAIFEWSSFRESTVEQIRHTLDVNFGSYVAATSLAVQRFMANGTSGAIVNISSIQARFPAPNWVAYGMSKAAIEGLTRAAAADGGMLGIRVNAVAPGGIMSERSEAWLESLDPAEGLRLRREFEQTHALNRRGHPSEVAAAIAFLLGADASFITGAVLKVDGGRSAWSWDPISSMKE